MNKPLPNGSAPVARDVCGSAQGCAGQVQSLLMLRGEFSLRNSHAAVGGGREQGQVAFLGQKVSIRTFHLNRDRALQRHATPIYRS